jgi:hypothetical protein
MIPDIDQPKTEEALKQARFVYRSCRAYAIREAVRCLAEKDPVAYLEYISLKDAEETKGEK